MCQGNTNVASCKKKKKEEKLGAEPHDRFLTPCGEEQKEEEEEEDKWLQLKCILTWWVSPIPTRPPTS